MQDSATRNCLQQMAANLTHELQEVADLRASFEVFKLPPQQARAKNPRLGNLNPNFVKGEQEKENYVVEQGNKPEPWSAREDDGLNVAPG